MSDKMEEIATQWLYEIKRSKKYSTFVKYESIYRCHLMSHMKNLDIGDISEEICRQMLREEYAGESHPGSGTLSKSVMDSICSVLNQILYFGGSPVTIHSKDVLAGLPLQTFHRLPVFSVHEQARLVHYLRQNVDSYKLGILTCLLTGIRLGEICALETRDIHLQDRFIIIHQTVQRIAADKGEKKTALLVTAPKTFHSERRIPICSTLEIILKKDMKESVYLVNGNRLMEPRTYQYLFHKILQKLSIERKGFHALRHTFATNCIASGMDPKCLSEILGHSDVKTTLNRYVHPSMEMKREQMDSFACYNRRIWDRGFRR